jgi:TatD DNase family protein
MYIDAHCHLLHAKSAENYPAHLDQIQKLMQEVGLGYIVSNTGVPENYPLIEHEKLYPKILTAIAINRNLAKTKANHAQYLQALRSTVEKIRPEAIGEVGLDYYALITPDYAPEAQQYILEQEILLAQEYDLPLIIHSLDSDADLLAILKRHHAEEMRVHIHGTQIHREFMQDFIDLGCYFSLSYYHHFDEPEKAFWIDHVPADRLLFETDSPYASALGKDKGQSSPADVISNYKLYSQRAGMDVNVIAKQVEKNFRRLYRL